MSWGISPNAPEKEKIKADYVDELHGFNSCCCIDYDTYSSLFSSLFDIGMDLLDRMYECEKKDAQALEED